MQDTIDFLKEKMGDFNPEIALVLGSGLGDFAKDLAGFEIPYSEIPGFKASTVKGHAGSIFFAEIHGKKVAIMQGRIHFYEGHSLAETTFYVKVLKKLGVSKIILTNAAGSVNLSYKPGYLMLIKDHINFMGQNPLVGPNDDSMGERFPDMSAVYDMDMRRTALECAKEQGIILEQGVYIAVTGPSYETPSEIKMFRAMGADAIGMSTVPEAIVCNYCGMKVLGISLMTNFAAGVSNDKLNHQEVVEMGKMASERFTLLVKGIIEKI